MNWLKNIFREIFGLFVEDGSFALAILLWLAIVRWAMPHLNLPAGITAVILFAGLALILVESATRCSRRKQ
ncbi:MAG TPA: hypothetical protein VGG81_00100 [Edaphobacter sp.]|jgi:hypothetical protein